MAGRSNLTFDELVEFDNLIAYSRYNLVAGVDEAGRGALAGPVVAAAVICRPTERLDRVRDSKLLSENLRESLYELIIDDAIAWGVGIVESDEIDRVNILNATMEAMKEAVASLAVMPEFVMVDGGKLPELAVPSKAVIGGDGKSFSIAAASIVAKVTRDRIMRARSKEFPLYGFARNKGYGTREHIAAIVKHGHSPFHRRSFKIKASI
ncbi:MAG: ribonuclease HII [Candidatus Latescibacteria bacterium 4484_7]|nr:MAG: ribonuclease HII [Candidatus Latescibacteria bacterium 4484_7]